MPPLAPAPRSSAVRPLSLVRAADASPPSSAPPSDPETPEEIWDCFSPVVRGLLRRALGPGADPDIEDHVQEVFLRFFQRTGAMREPDKKRSFLVGITMRVAKEHLRWRYARRWLSLTEPDALPESAAPSRDDDAREAVARLYAILDRIGTEGRLAFVLRHLEGLELMGVAEGLGLSLATTKRRLDKVTPQVLALCERDPILSDYTRRWTSGVR